MHKQREPQNWEAQGLRLESGVANPKKQASPPRVTLRSWSCTAYNDVGTNRQVSPKLGNAMAPHCGVGVRLTR